MAGEKFPQQPTRSLADYYTSYFQTLSRAAQTLDLDKLNQAESLLRAAIQSGHRVFSCGNGGSAAIANHLQCDFMKGISTHTSYIPHIHSLSAEISTISAIANDISYDEVFAFQVRRVMSPGDVLVAISSSGQSPNIIKALEATRAMQGQSILLCGFEGGQGLALADVALHFSVQNYGIVEDLHQSTMHILAQFIRMQALSSADFKQSKF